MNPVFNKLRLDGFNSKNPFMPSLSKHDDRLVQSASLDHHRDMTLDIVIYPAARYILSRFPSHHRRQKIAWGECPTVGASDVVSANPRLLQTILRHMDALRRTIEGDELYGLIARVLRKHGRGGPVGTWSADRPGA